MWKCEYLAGNNSSTGVFEKRDLPRRTGKGQGWAHPQPALVRHLSPRAGCTHGWRGVTVLCLADLPVCIGPSAVQWEATDKRRKIGFIQWEHFAPWQGTRQLLKVFSPCCFRLFSTGYTFHLNKSEDCLMWEKKDVAQGKMNQAFIFSKMRKISDLCNGSLIFIYIKKNGNCTGAILSPRWYI